MPIEQAPNLPLPQDYVPPDGVPYRVQDGDNWWSIAGAAGMDVWELIEFNFQTREPKEVNWYLRRNVGCCQATVDHKNWMFSSDASPGIIYLPPEEEEVRFDEWAEDEGVNGFSGDEHLTHRPDEPQLEEPGVPDFAEEENATGVIPVCRDLPNTINTQPAGYHWFSA